jgi:ornithine cyclodeaminase/alanine dehydrogenase-like protein (mu-crystallin family)
MDKLLIVGRALVRRLLPLENCIGLMEQAFRAASDGSAVQGLRGITPVPGDAGGVLGVMPGGLTNPPRFGVKVISVLHGRSAQSHQGGVLLFDAADFAPLALIHAGEVTAIRTAAATAVATRVLARADARVLAVLGTGEQAETHIRALALVRQWDEIRIWGRSRAKALRLAETIGEAAGCTLRVADSVAGAVVGAGVVCTVTASATPIFTADMIEPGMHLNLVGASVASAREVDSATVARASMFADHEAMARTAGGEFITALQEGAIGADHIRGELGSVLLGRMPGRQTAGEVTMFKSLGMPVEDLFAADCIYAEARRLGVGTLAPF